jgi:hypothetical protein
MVAAYEPWFMIMIMLPYMLLCSEAVLMCTYLQFFETCFCFGFTLWLRKVTPPVMLAVILRCLLVITYLFEWLTTISWCDVLGFADLPLAQGVRLVLYFNQLPNE